MKTIMMIVSLALITSTLASAQAENHRYRGQGYIFVGEGMIQDDGLRGNSQVGGGAELFVHRGLAVGGEMGAMGRAGEGLGVLSTDASYHFLRYSSDMKWVPFVEGGYTRTFGNNSPAPPGNLINFGVGIHYWAFRRAGLRLEFRDHARLSLLGYPAHLWGVRIGLAFR